MLHASAAPSDLPDVANTLENKPIVVGSDQQEWNRNVSYR